MSQRTGIRPRPILDRTARELLDAVDADPLAPIQVGVVAPGGYGKTTVLAELEQIYQRAGVEVVHARHAPTDVLDDALANAVASAGSADDGVEGRGAGCGRGSAPSSHGDRTVLVVDDAHQLGESQLRDLCRLAESPRVRLVAAYRPWPRPPALTELAGLLARTRPPLMPQPFDHEQVAALLTRTVGAQPRPTLVESLHGQTGGVPRFVDRVLTALAGGAAKDGRLEIPQAAIAQFRYDIDRLDPDVQRFLLAVEAGVGRHLDLLCALLRRDVEEVGEVMEAARATGLLGRDGTLLPISKRAIGTLVPAERRISTRQRLAELQLARGASVLGLARSLLGTGIGGTSVAATFEAAAHEAMRDHPALATELFAAAVAAGRPIAALAAPWSRAAALAGDLDSALRLADQVIAGGDAADRADGAGVAAAALAYRGQLGRSAELYRWAGDGPAASFAAVGLIGTGEPAAAEELLTAQAPASDGPPTLLAGAAALLAQGMRTSVTGSTLDALSTLVRAAGLLEPAGHGVLLPDSPAALAALVALHCGELNIAESVLERAVTANLGGTLLSARHRLLKAWVFMLRGQTAAAVEQLTLVTKAAKALEPRDWLFAVALEVGLARRNSDVPTLRRLWAAACEAVMRHPVDLFTLLPLGEFATAAARLRDQGRLAPHLLEARALLARLGDPPLWATQLHWSGLHSAIVAEQPAAAEEHAAALTANASHSRYCGTLAAAAECWLGVIAGKIDPEQVDAAARGLHAMGLSWDGARLAGQAAIRTSDRKAMVSLLDCARILQGKPTSPKSSAAPAATAASAATADALGGVQLSDREREVAALVLEGHTYKQVGDRLFISAKTVEHHMARIRQRLGVSNRSELLAQLRQLLTEEN